jgi:hypothetical protein
MAGSSTMCTLNCKPTAENHLEIVKKDLDEKCQCKTGYTWDKGVKKCNKNAEPGKKCPTAPITMYKYKAFGREWCDKCPDTRTADVDGVKYTIQTGLRPTPDGTCVCGSDV